MEDAHNGIKDEMSVLVCACQDVVILYKLQAGRPKKSFLFGHLFFNITNVFCAKKSAKKRVGHACIYLRMVTD